MTNTSVKAFITQFGNRVFGLTFNNDVSEVFGYGNEKDIVTDVTFRDADATASDDLIIASHTMNYNGTELHYKVIHETDALQWIGVMDAKSNDYRPDPIIAKGF